MPQSNAPVIHLPDAIATLRAHRLRWLVPTVCIFAFAFVYAMVRRPTWEASQALLIRDEAIGSDTRPGRFNGTDDMKTAQETIVELAKSRSVIEAALRQVGAPSSDRKSAAWPKPADIDKTRKAISLVAPNGAEFGRTEVFYLKVKDKSRQRAIEFATALYEQLDRHTRDVRGRKAQGLIDELTKTMNLAESDLADSTARLAAIEQRVGSDLAELRLLDESTSGESNLRRTLGEVENETRRAIAAEQANAELLRVLNEAAEVPDRLVATPNRLLESQPALRRLKDGLVDAQLATSRLLGTMTEQHPKVIMAKEAEDAVRNDLHQELAVAIRGVEAELRLIGTQSSDLKQKAADLRRRMSQLARERANYRNVLADVEQRREILRDAQKNLAEARASQAASHSASLITALNRPETGENPLGPRRVSIVLTGLLGGLLTGFGLVFLTVPPANRAGPEHLHRAARNGAATNGHAAASTDSAFHGLSMKQALSHLAGRMPPRN